MGALLQDLVNRPYKHGFVTDIESDVAAKGLTEDTIRLISAAVRLFPSSPEPCRSSNQEK